jgi:diguanylate cyclase (GGDEF)-like protein
VTHPETRVWQGLDRLPDERVVDVIVSDERLNDDRLPAAIARRLACREIGLVGIGHPSPSDVCLPADVTARELRVACCLLAETIHLRRECHRSRRLQHAWNQLALTDSLTGLPNRRAWDDELLDRGARAEGPSAARCLALLDLDHFKKINDAFGHLAGDEVLQFVGHRLAEAVQSGDFVSRLGGDEFGLLLQGTQAADLVQRAESLRTGVCSGATPAVTASVGLAVVMGPDTATDYDLLRAADAALRTAKQAGRDCSRRCEPAIESADRRDDPNSSEKAPCGRSRCPS